MTTWTDDMIDLMKKEHARGLSCSQIAKVLNGEFRHVSLTRNAVIGALHRRGVRFDAPARPARAAKPAREPRPPKPPPAIRLAPPPVIPFEPATLGEVPDTARPWLERTGQQCAFPVAGIGADLLSCCAPVRAEGESYCGSHHALAYQPLPSKTRTPGSYERSLRRFASA
jgi:hypothetical protein